MGEHAPAARRASRARERATSARASARSTSSTRSARRSPRRRRCSSSWARSVRRARFALAALLNVTVEPPRLRRASSRERARERSPDAPARDAASADATEARVMASASRSSPSRLPRASSRSRTRSSGTASSRTRAGALPGAFGLLLAALPVRPRARLARRRRLLQGQDANGRQATLRAARRCSCSSRTSSRGFVVPPSAATRASACDWPACARSRVALAAGAPRRDPAARRALRRSSPTTARGRASATCISRTSSARPPGSLITGFVFLDQLSLADHRRGHRVHRHGARRRRSSSSRTLASRPRASVRRRASLAVASPSSSSRRRPRPTTASGSASTTRASSTDDTTFARRRRDQERRHRRHAGRHRLRRRRVRRARQHVDRCTTATASSARTRIGAMHPDPKKVLMIGLATGSWAQVIAQPARASSTSRSSRSTRATSSSSRSTTEVKSLLTNPKVDISIDDGRRWLQSPPESTVRLHRDEHDVALARATHEPALGRVHGARALAPRAGRHLLLQHDVVRRRAEDGHDRLPACAPRLQLHRRERLAVLVRQGALAKHARRR